MRGIAGVSDTRTVRVKICGITTTDAALAAAAAGADAIGLVFYNASPRHLADLGRARDIALAAGPLINVVGLFVNPQPAELEKVLGQVPLSLLQFHGDESEAFCCSFARPYLKALRMKPGVDIKAAADAYSGAAGLLLDAYRPGIPGGTGEVFDWQQIPPSLPRPLVLAGGLTPTNVAQAVATVRPWAVDVSGGVESSPGIKDVELIRQFISRAKAVPI
jgi:phosphoribosylanthranilate isomerase